MPAKIKYELSSKAFKSATPKPARAVVWVVGIIVWAQSALTEYRNLTGNADLEVMGYTLSAHTQALLLIGLGGLVHLAMKFFHYQEPKPENNHEVA